MSEQELEKADSGRRDFLKKSLVAGAVVWGAPAVTSLPGGRAWAQTYEQCICTGDAFGLSLSLLGGAPTVFGENGSLVDVGPIAIPVLGGFVQATAVTGTETSSVDGACGGQASIATLDLVVGSPVPTLTVRAAVITSQASANCAPCGTAGSSALALLVVNGITVNVTSQCNNDVLNLGLIVLNEQTCDANGNLTVNALHITVPGIVEIIAAHSAAGATGCACVACA